MSKAKTLASIVADGGPLADGQITAADIGGLTLPTGGDIVGTTATQTLTNKTIDGASNTLSNVNLASQVTGTLPVANGGTGAASLTANNVLLGNGTSALQVVAPGSSGNVLTSNGTTWTSAAAPAGALVLLSTVNATSGSSTVNIETGFSSTYDYYVLEFDDITLVDNGWHSYIGIRLKLNGSYVTTNYYSSSGWTSTASGSTMGAYNNAVLSGIPIGVNSINTNYSSYRNKASGQLWIYNPNTANSIKTLNWVIANVVTTAPANEFLTGSGFSTANYGTLRGIQFLPLERPFQAQFSTGTFRLYGFAKT